MIGLAEILIAFGVLTLAATYVLIVRSFIHTGERGNAPTRSMPAAEAPEDGHLMPATEHLLHA
jgi:hypothetical protein